MSTVVEDKARRAAQQNVDHQLRHWAEYPWPADGDEWSGPFGGTRSLWATIIYPRVASYLPAGDVLEIAPGHGRCTQFLLPLSGHLTIVDLVPACIESCRARFGERSDLTYAVNDGWTLPMIPDASIDFAFSWDSLVHVEREPTRSYFRELGRVLRPGGHAFVHHSNLGAYPERIAEFDWARQLHGRGRSTTAASVRETCAQSGLQCLSQELIPWGGTGLCIDAFTLVRRADGPAPATLVEEHTHWAGEAAQARRLARLYPARTAPE